MSKRKHIPGKNISTADPTEIVLLPAGPGRWVRMRRTRKHESHPGLCAEVIEYSSGPRKGIRQYRAATLVLKDKRHLPDSVAYERARKLAAQMRGGG